MQRRLGAKPRETGMIHVRPAAHLPRQERVQLRERPHGPPASATISSGRTSRYRSTPGQPTSSRSAFDRATAPADAATGRSRAGSVGTSTDPATNTGFALGDKIVRARNEVSTSHRPGSPRRAAASESTAQMADIVAADGVFPSARRDGRRYPAAAEIQRDATAERPRDSRAGHATNCWLITPSLPAVDAGTPGTTSLMTNTACGCGSWASANPASPARSSLRLNQNLVSREPRVIDPIACNDRLDASCNAARSSPGTSARYGIFCARNAEVRPALSRCCGPQIWPVGSQRSDQYGFRTGSPFDRKSARAA